MANDSIARALAIAALENGGGGEGGTTNYNDLENKPKINGVTLTGDKTLDDLGIDGNNVSMADSGWFPNSSVKQAIEETFDSIQAGSGVTVDKNYDAHTVTISATGGGGGTNIIRIGGNYGTLTDEQYNSIDETTVIFCGMHRYEYDQRDNALERIVFVKNSVDFGASGTTQKYIHVSFDKTWAVTQRTLQTQSPYDYDTNRIATMADLEAAISGAIGGSY